MTDHESTTVFENEDICNIGDYRIPLDERHEFCEDSLWDVNVTLKSEQRDFTLCFHSTVLVYVPCLFLWFSMPYLLYQWKLSEITTNPDNRQQNVSLIFLLRFIFQGALLVLSLGGVIWNVNEFWNYSYSTTYSKPISEVIAPTILSLTFALYLRIGITEQQNESQSYLRVQCGFWILLTLTSTFTFISIVRFPEKRSHSYNVTYWFYYFLVVISLFLEICPSGILGYLNNNGELNIISIYCILLI